MYNDQMRCPAIAVKWNPLSDPTIADNELRADL